MPYAQCHRNYCRETGRCLFWLWFIVFMIHCALKYVNRRKYTWLCVLISLNSLWQHTAPKNYAPTAREEVSRAINKFIFACLFIFVWCNGFYVVLVLYGSFHPMQICFASFRQNYLCSRSVSYFLPRPIAIVAQTKQTCISTAAICIFHVAKHHIEIATYRDRSQNI